MSSLLARGSSEEESEIPTRESRAVRESQLYVLGEQGHIYAYAEYPGVVSATFLGSMCVISLDGTPYSTEIDGVKQQGSACVAAPKYSKVGNERNCKVGFAFSPLSDVHRALLTLESPRVRWLARELFAELDDELQAAMDGRLTFEAGVRLHAAVGEICLRNLPAPRPMDERIAAVARAIAADPRITVKALAKSVAMSADRLSHVFTERIGLDMRRFRLAIKLSRAMLLTASMPETSLTEIAQLAGFSDSAHFSRVCRAMYGGAPRLFLSRMRVHPAG